MRSGESTTHPSTGFRPALLLIPFASTGFGAVSGVAVDASLPLAGFGLVWGVIAMLLAPRLAARGQRSPRWAQIPLYVACAIAFMSLGAAILGDLLTPDAQSAFEFTRIPAFGFYFMTVHLTFEWVLLPAAVMLNWHDRGRRTLLLVAMVAFYGMRMVSAVYFAPTAMAWGQLPADTVVTGQLLAEVEAWTALNWVRRVFQELLVTALLVVATLRPGATRPAVSVATAPTPRT
ncbi:hypothetical protein J4H86_18830 [Spiractinospora alimapuensis]|uniref:hypothetical protein n=1 Tax=Spiractinospora alimapuensis TaxID=2820884 RepID=UPI001F407223|nr:hypothetical protein [Spiractinospora alimapuensis]QVQ50899.1 hypothetical protein J4H86_18830 [Spiractinospora alimapuensis]